MRKVLLSILTITLLLTSASSFVLAEDVYVPSIDVKHDVVLIDASSVDEPTTTKISVTDHNSYATITYSDDCYVELIVTPYRFRDTIKKTESKTEIQLAYEDVIDEKYETVVDMAPVLKGYGKKFGIEDYDLIVSNLFDVTLYVYESGKHDKTYEHKHVYSIKFSAEALKNFVCLMHYNAYAKAGEEAWSVVDGAYVTGINRDRVNFVWDCDDLSPFAIISKQKEGSYNGGSYTNINTGVFGSVQHKCLVDFNGHCYCLEVLVLLVVSIFLNVYLVLKNKKYKEDQKIKNEGQIK